MGKHSGRHKDLTGKRFGRLVVLNKVDQRSHSDIMWKCLCDCGNKSIVRGSNLRTGNTKSCGCGQDSFLRQRAIDLSYERFGLLTAIKPTSKRDGNSIVWECRCVCGKFVYKSVEKLKDAYSCGCSTRMRKPPKYIGEKHHCWKGGRVKDSYGYIRVLAPAHPFAYKHDGRKRGYVLEHRLVMEKCIGRYLKPEERVHHIDQDRTNNDPDNLLLFPNVTAHLAHHRVLKKIALGVGII